MTVEGGASSRWQRHVVSTLREVADAGDDTGAPARWRRLGGTASTSHWSLNVAAARFFVKVVDAQSWHLLDAERDGLHAIAATNAVRVPQVAACAQGEGAAFLVLEWLDIVATGGGAALGHALARLHATTSARFGWHADNTIGPSPQSNAWRSDWSEFFRDQRLRVQLDLASRSGYADALARDGERLLERVPALIGDHRPSASLLHGDLWSGNAARLKDDSPAIYDPAAYYGDRETDLAMTSLFGGFDASFYAAYVSALPLPAGHERRRTLYNLYHVLNHLNLFGASYLALARRMMAELLAQR